MKAWLRWEGTKWCFYFMELLSFSLFSKIICEPVFNFFIRWKIFQKSISAYCVRPRVVASRNVAKLASHRTTLFDLCCEIWAEQFHSLSPDKYLQQIKLNVCVPSDVMVSYSNFMYVTLCIGLFHYFSKLLQIMERSESTLSVAFSGILFLWKVKWQKKGTTWPLSE